MPDVINTTNTTLHHLPINAVDVDTFNNVFYARADQHQALTHKHVYKNKALFTKTVSTTVDESLTKPIHNLKELQTLPINSVMNTFYLSCISNSCSTLILKSSVFRQSTT